MNAEPRVALLNALHVSVTGLVQGVGFRPFVHRLAIRHGLAGWVRNRAGDVEITLEGSARDITAFVAALEREAPPLARIARIESQQVETYGHDAFRILASSDAPDLRQPVSPDVATCDACAKELLDPLNRRHRYPFITCTDCGPRYTVIERMPYDRARTTMRLFKQCPECQREYETPGDRRYHSETNSCVRCGPRLWYVERDDPAFPPAGDAAIDRTAARLLVGGIVAIRGLGGFHLAVDATNEEAVAELRQRKHREAKPLAIMVRTVDDARRVAHVNDAEAALLASPERPILLLQRIDNTRLAEGIATGLGTIGVMLAYTPLHHLLLEAVGRPLVMTSGNRSEEPIATSNSEALERLRGIADAFLLHNREIVSRYDDSVVRVVGDAPVQMRRARGFAPLPVALPFEAPRPILAVGPHLKNTFTLVHGRTAYVSQHIGDLENLETLEHFRSALELFGALFRISPAVIARDMHPGYLSSRIAEELGVLRIIDVQHHHAHVAAVAAEHGLDEQILGLAFDGTGLGDDGNVWGAEFLLADARAYKRLGHLRYAPLPGGDLVARRPWRAALGYLSLEPAASSAFTDAFLGVSALERAAAEHQIERHINTPLASSMGRLFDAAAAVIGVRTVSHYEGHAAMQLESLAGVLPAQPLPFPIVEDGEGWVLDPLPLLSALGELRAQGAPIADLAAAFHESVAATSVLLAHRIRDVTNIGTVALCGGVFQNARLLESTRAGLTKRGFRVLVPRLLPPNDGGVSFGQAVIAAALLRMEGGSRVPRNTW